MYPPWEGASEQHLYVGIKLSVHIDVYTLQSTRVAHYKNVQLFNIIGELVAHVKLKLTYTACTVRATLVLSGKREVPQSFFLEPTTGWDSVWFDPMSVYNIQKNGPLTPLLARFACQLVYGMEWYATLMDSACVRIIIPMAGNFWKSVNVFMEECSVCAPPWCYTTALQYSPMWDNVLSKGNFCVYREIMYYHKETLCIQRGNMYHYKVYTS